MEHLYKGIGLDSQYVGYIDNNSIFDSRRGLIGSIEGNSIYCESSLMKTCVGCVSDNYVEDNSMFSKVVGSFSEGRAYYGFEIGSEIAGECSSVYGAAALVLLLAPIPDNQNLEKSEPEEVSYNTEQGFFYILKTALLLGIPIFFALAIWPLVLQESMHDTLEDTIYTFLLILSTAVGLIYATKSKKTDGWFAYMIQSGLVGGALETFFVLIFDSTSITNPLMLLLPFIIVFFASIVPGTILYFIFKRRN